MTITRKVDKNNQVVGIIPARYASTRFPGKPLAIIAKKPMIQWVYERAQKARSLSRVIVATDDDRIYIAVKAFNGQVQMTRSDHESGTDRVAEVAESLDAKIIVNIQGDEPLIEPAGIDQLVTTITTDNGCQMATLVRKITNPEELKNINTARVVIDRNCYALYFSRAVIPHVRDVSDIFAWPDYVPIYDQVGIYAYRKDFLLTFSKLEKTGYEAAEKLEQLRALEHGYRIKVGIVNFFPICVDVPGDIAIVEKRITELGLIGD